MKTQHRAVTHHCVANGQTPFPSTRGKSRVIYEIPSKPAQTYISLVSRVQEPTAPSLPQQAEQAASDVPRVDFNHVGSTNVDEPQYLATSSIQSLITATEALVKLVQPLSINRDPLFCASPLDKPKRQYTKREERCAVEIIPLVERPILAFKQAPALYPKSEQAFRRLARQAEQYKKYPKAGLPSNGFEKCIVRPPGSRNIYLDAKQLALWWAVSGQGGVQ